jgi:hypothetical protein
MGLQVKPAMTGTGRRLRFKPAMTGIWKGLQIKSAMIPGFQYITRTQL